MLIQSTLRTQLYSLFVGMVVLFGMFTLLAWNIVSGMRDDAIVMGLGKDVVADILPPPLYVIEAELIAEELRRTTPAGVENGFARLQSLKQEYDQRNAYWETANLDREVKQSLLGAQKRRLMILGRGIRKLQRRHSSRTIELRLTVNSIKYAMPTSNTVRALIKR